MMGFAQFATGGVLADLAFDKLSKDIPAAKMTYANAMALKAAVPKNQ